MAVIDSGIDAEHPELKGQIAAGTSFVGSSWQSDTNGHGTFVAGEIAAALNNEQGIAGIAFPAELLVAKVVRSDGTISPDAEARAIRWAVDHGARVINLSFGGMRDPADKARDTYSPLEAAAIQYAVSNGVLVVAAVGNGDGAPEQPWSYAGYPAALPHVLGVSAVARDGSVPAFSNRDARLQRPLRSRRGHPLDAAAGDHVERPPGLRPPGLLGLRADRVPPRRGDVLLRAAGVRGRRAHSRRRARSSKPDQVAALLTRTANDAEPDSGCERCWPGRDSLTGWGVLDVADAVQALDGTLPEPDRFEANDEAATAARLWGRKGRRIKATIDYWDDQVDVYKIKLRRGQRLVARLRGPRGTNTNLFLWKPGTRRVAGSRGRSPPARRAVHVSRLGRANPGACAGDRLVLPRGEGLDGGRRQVLAQLPEASSAGCASSSSSVATSRICRAGLPTTTARGGTSRMTTAPAPT